MTTSLDYMVDGIISLRDFNIDYGKAREMEIKKLRGTNIKQPKYAFTLNGGKFQCLLPFERRRIPNPKKLMPLQNSSNSISTGNEDLDSILGGGYRKGSFNVIEVRDDLSSWGFVSLIGFTMINFIAQKNWFVCVPSSGRDESYVRKRIGPFVSKESYDERVRVFEIGEDTKRDNVINLKGESIEDDLKEINDFISGLDPPVLTHIEASILEDSYRLGEADRLGLAAKELSKHIAMTKMKGNIDIVMVYPDLMLTKKLIHMANTYFKLTTHNGTVVFYGVRPETGLYYFDTVVSDGYVKAKLTHSV
jgi:hypothetical protein